MEAEESLQPKIAELYVSKFKKYGALEVHEIVWLLEDLCIRISRLEDGLKESTKNSDN